MEIAPKNVEIYSIIGIFTVDDFPQAFYSEYHILSQVGVWELPVISLI